MQPRQRWWRAVPGFDDGGRAWRGMADGVGTETARETVDTGPVAGNLSGTSTRQDGCGTEGILRMACRVGRQRERSVPGFETGEPGGQTRRRGSKFDGAVAAGERR